MGSILAEQLGLAPSDSVMFKLVREYKEHTLGSAHPNKYAGLAKTPMKMFAMYDTIEQDTASDSCLGILNDSPTVMPGALSLVPMSFLSTAREAGNISCSKRRDYQPCGNLRCTDH